MRDVANTRNFFLSAMKQETRQDYKINRIQSATPLSFLSRGAQLPLPCSGEDRGEGDPSVNALSRLERINIRALHGWLANAVRASIQSEPREHYTETDGKTCRRVRHHVQRNQTNRLS